MNLRHNRGRCQYLGIIAQAAVQSPKHEDGQDVSGRQSA